MSKNQNKPTDHQIEKDRLKALLEIHSKQLKADVEGIKQSLEPVQDVVGSIGKFSTKEGKRQLIYAGVDISMALLTKKLVFTRSNWFNNLALPILVRSLSNEPVQPPLKTKNPDAFDIVNGYLKTFIAKKMQTLQ